MAEDSTVVFGADSRNVISNERFGRGRGGRGGRGKRKKTKQEQIVLQEVNNALHRQQIKSRVIKYFDTFLNNQSSTSTVGYSDITVVPQGVAQSQRVADTIWVQRIEIRGSMVLANADGYGIMRWGVFIFKQNTASITPGSGTVWESAATYSVYSPYNFEGREYITMLIDRAENLIGSSTVYTDRTQIVIMEQLNRLNHRVDFELGLTTGSGHIYFVNVSDSAVVPHPTYFMEFRVWYYDE